MFNLNEFIKHTSGPQRALDYLAGKALVDLREQWLDEASEFAVNGNPRRTQYIYSAAGIA